MHVDIHRPFFPFTCTSLPTLAGTVKGVLFTSTVNRVIDCSVTTLVFPYLEDHLDYSPIEATVLELGLLSCWY